MHRSVHLIWETRASADVGICGGPGTNPLQILRDNLRSGGIKGYMQIFNWAGVSAPNSYIVQRSTVSRAADRVAYSLDCQPGTL